ncbi:rhodanese-like domain-containing protein [Candidatus Gottesmanbacteria bacterium]|nr:rhodanese-like domain-containing protein [Candidatus Gottesmanbacteria bacterium]MBI5452949.1 rhodanese-like domain-containing protein [Candidatus Gottesmanbacteria bacterium]
MNKYIYILLFIAFIGGWLYIYNIHQIRINYVPIDITSDQLYVMLKNKDFYFVNVHIPYEGEIEKTDAFIPYNEIDKNLDKLLKDKNAKIVLYCRSGKMSAEAAKKLTDLGYTNVYNQLLGMHDWQSKGYQILKGGDMK